MLHHVWRVGTVGPLSLPHRIVMGSMHLGLEGHDDGGHALAAFYRERAAAGAALIVTGGSAVSRVGAGGRNYSFINDPSEWQKLDRVASAVREAGGRTLLQLFHAGRYAYESSFGLQPVAPSAVYSRYSRAEPRALSEADLMATIDDFASGAARARELGFDGVEIMGSEGYLLNQFMAPLTNRREDDWGGDAERRMRFPLEVAAAVREASGPGQAVVYRISGADLVDGGTPQDEVLELARRLAGGPVDALNVGIGWHEARIPTVQALVPHGAWIPWVEAIKRAVDVPVIASNRVNTLELAERVLARGAADYVSIARPFLADAEVVRKGQGGERVNICIACNQACIDRSIFDQRVSCVVNPRAGYELEMPATRRTSPAERRRVAVVGGGPAGMEAARSFAAAGDAVALFEAGERLGGQFRMACRIPGKEDFAKTIEYFEAELPRLGVEVRLGVAIDEGAELEGYDAVVVATGVVPKRIQLPGVGLPHVVSYGQLLSGERDAGESVAIIGAGGIGVDAAHMLSHPRSLDPADSFYRLWGLAVGDPDTSARSVSLMCRSPRAGGHIGPSTRWAVLETLKRSGVEILTGVHYREIQADGVAIVDDQGSERLIPAQTVVIAAGQEPNAGLAAALERAGRPHLVIGGAASATELDAERAFREGTRAPEKLDQLTGVASAG